ncbi:histone family protein DNA-binding protein [Thermodesulfatator indicus DSM 15286]|uniref:Histone family protein DNA-binding protein n=1 Tax=Thermodesulfatator indicus (strain DSM 15286 / JCM 11887 / CIR29812) TaxID=667014 RepID=F8ADQ9_THEID|nr:HU family DNA-binding protein [Thermodesulfatator indicus]AEH46017.1 histone family protein DNA-binding protein [Thermodesulfatator indicus DSM 15286]
MSRGRKEFLERVYERAGKRYKRLRPSRFQTREAVEAILAILEEAFLEEENIKISGFGTFEIKKGKSKLVRDFSSGGTKKSLPKKRIVFKASAKFLKELN